LTGSSCFRSIGSESDGCGSKRGGWIGSGPLDHDPAARDTSMRRGGGRRRRPATRGGGLAGETLSRVPGLDSMRGKHLDAAHGTANPGRR
jgi:hypothetical protein